MLKEEAPIPFIWGIHVHAHGQATHGIGIVDARTLERHDATEAGKDMLMERQRIEASIAVAMYLGEYALFCDAGDAHDANLSRQCGRPGVAPRMRQSVAHAA